MLRRPLRSTRTDTLLPYTTFFRSPLSILRKIRFSLSEPYEAHPDQRFPAAPAPDYRHGTKALTWPFSRNYLRRSEEHTSELQSLMRTSYAVFCLKKKIIANNQLHTDNNTMLINTTYRHQPQ